MTVLSAQSIRRLGIFEPFSERTRCELSGLSYGLSACGYDVRVREQVLLRPGEFALASTLEHFAVPSHCVCVVHDKSTLARMGLAVQNTVAEPGWCGYLTLELTNHGRMIIELAAGQPVAQILVHPLDEPTEQPYVGRYQNQEARPVLPRLLRGDEEQF